MQEVTAPNKIVPIIIIIWARNSLISVELAESLIFDVRSEPNHHLQSKDNFDLVSSSFLTERDENGVISVTLSLNAKISRQFKL